MRAGIASAWPSVVVLAALAACGPSGVDPVDLGPTDGSVADMRVDTGPLRDLGARDANTDAFVGVDAGPRFCASNLECDDGVFCNGEERCMPGAPGATPLGCIPPTSPRCLGGQTCDETMDRCLSMCDRAPDADGDGAPAINCGGNDCDDADPMRKPGAMEVCTAASLDHDEDCDPRTFGVLDADRDTFVDAHCCNGTTCGNDCDDTRMDVHPAQSDACDGTIDHNCSGDTTDEVPGTFYADCDGDGFGAGEPLRGCTPARSCMNHVDVIMRTDCDDANAAVKPGAVEVCDGIDNDCNATTVEGRVTYYQDCDGDGVGAGAPLMACSAGRTCMNHVDVMSSNDCDDMNAARLPGAAETCDGVDNNCVSGIADEVRRPYYADCDGDGFGAGVVIMACAPGRTCMNNLDVASSSDCDDTTAARRPGGTEICDTLDNDCANGVDDTFVCTGMATRSCMTACRGPGTQMCSGCAYSMCSPTRRTAYPYDGMPKLSRMQMRIETRIDDSDAFDRACYSLRIPPEDGGVAEEITQHGVALDPGTYTATVFYAVAMPFEGTLDVVDRMANTIVASIPVSYSGSSSVSVTFMVTEAAACHEFEFLPRRVDATLPQTFCLDRIEIGM